MDIQSVLRWLITAIALLIGIILLIVVLKVAGFLLGYAIKALVILLFAAIVLRFIGILRSRRRR